VIRFFLRFNREILAEMGNRPSQIRSSRSTLPSATLKCRDEVGSLLLAVFLARPRHLRHLEKQYRAMRKQGMANERKSLSAAGRSALERSEGYKTTYYDDTAQNCTYGVGTLAHMGPCTPAERGRPVSNDMIERSLAQGVREAERIVRRAVKDHELTQAQFDAAVSFAYNVRNAATKALKPANRGDMASVARNISQFVYEHPHDAHGHVSGPARLNHGLVGRRRRESMPFKESKP
jgi:lysozyme